MASKYANGWTPSYRSLNKASYSAFEEEAGTFGHLPNTFSLAPGFEIEGMQDIDGLDRVAIKGLEDAGANHIIFEVRIPPNKCERILKRLARFLN